MTMLVRTLVSQLSRNTAVLTKSLPARCLLSSMPDYDTRATKYGFLRPPELKELLNTQPTAVLLDVRTQEEIDDSGRFTWKDLRWVHQSCTGEDATELAQKADELFPDETTPIVVYCKSGHRANKAQEVLTAGGHASVYNAGGYDDIKGLD